MGRFYEGAFYARVMEPMQRRLHELVARRVEADQRVLDAGCGAGGLALRLARTAREVVGVDLAPRMIATAEARRRRAAAHNLRFVTGDVASALADLDDGHFDAATLVLALHEMPSASREPVLRELCRVARRVECFDFRIPMPRNLAGLRNRAFEVAAGPEHFRAFRDYTARGGVSAIAAAAGVDCDHVRDIDRGAMTIVTLRARRRGCDTPAAGQRGTAPGTW